MLYDLEGGEPSAIPGTEPGDVPVRFTPDGRAPLRARPRRRRARRDPPCRRRRRGIGTLWKEIAPADPIGVFGVPRVFLSADGRSYVYSFVRMLDELFLVDGLR